MYRNVRLLLISAAAMALLAAAVGGASAGRLSITDRTSRIIWRRWDINSSSGSTVSCTLTMEGSFHSGTIHKRFKALIGHITRAAVNACTGGTATVRQETLPWHRTYMGFDGTLPRPTRIRSLFSGLSADVTSGGVTCGVRTETGNNATGSYVIEAGGGITELSWDTETAIRPTSGGFLCEIITFTFAGSGAYTRLGSASTATLRLI